SSLLNFSVKRHSPELIPPAAPTPHEFKNLSDIDDQQTLRFLLPAIYFFNGNQMDKDIVAVMRRAISKALVFYYPLAGRTREIAGKKLLVECTGEGVMFVAADADVALEDFGDPLHPPFPGIDKLLFDIDPAGEVTNSALMYFQVTRLRCGGFALSLLFNHTITDGFGASQFARAMFEFARGDEFPSVLPVWKRHLLSARDPPRVTCTHREYDHDEEEGTNTTTIQNHGSLHLLHRAFFFGADEIAALRRRLPPEISRCSVFELVTGCIWRCRTIAISPSPDEEVRIICPVNARNRFNPPIPVGYYGNAIGFSMAVSTARNLFHSPLHYAMKLVKQACDGVTEEYMKSVADLMVLKGRPRVITERTYRVSDIRYSGVEEVDFGWGKPAYGGTAKCGGGLIPGASSYYIASRNDKGEKGFVAPICLPPPAMEVFAREMNDMLN
ncbi:hypothetical protein M569_06766, partial [Genlisea aurea]